VLRVRWLGKVPYGEAHALQRALNERGCDDYLLLLEHPHVVTLGLRGDPSHVLVDPSEFGGTLVRTDRGGDVTYHGPGQLVAYPLINVPMGRRGIPCYVNQVEQVVIDTLADLGLRSGRLEGYPGVWVDPFGESPRKICAVGIRVTRGRSMHGIALNVKTDMEWFERIVPCGIREFGVTSLEQEGIACSMEQVVERFVERAAEAWAPDGAFERQDVAGLGAKPPIALDGHEGPDPRRPREPATPVPGHRAKVRLRQAGVDPAKAIPLRERKPEWLRAPVVIGTGYRSLGKTMRDLNLVTVCEEAGCPNIYECWAEGTATFMINGDRCTRACGFCLVDTRHPLALDPAEPDNVAEAVSRMNLAHAVVTAVARDDLPDGGAGGFASTVRAIRRRCPGTSVEVLISDCKGDPASLETIFDSGPEVLNHNLETVARLQRAVRPSAGYARSLSVLARASRAGLVTKSGVILGMGETTEEVRGALVDLRSVGVSIVTLGQYLRPSVAHIPVARWWTPDEFEEIGTYARGLGFDHVEASPLTRSSYHARRALDSVSTRSVGVTA
jgi:lipoyl synthase